ncbi:MAG: DNA/RNA non-specific endonuclease [Alistipes sp.]|nr:DNA/RNA non-specific endonuclease [Alistipes sp.]
MVETYSACVKLITDAAAQADGSYRRNYSICYDPEHYVALWVAYPMHTWYTSGSNDSTTFVIDPAFSTSQQVTNTYATGYSRGHQIAKAQRKVTALARKQTNYYTNMTPQNQTLNGGKWATLESNERGAWMCSDTLYCVSGCHFDNYNTTTTNNDGKTCPVPTHYYKVMLRTVSGNTGKSVTACSASELKCIGYWVEHNASAVPQAMSVADIERLTGQTFFVNVPNAPKGVFNESQW